MPNQNFYCQMPFKNDNFNLLWHFKMPVGKPVMAKSL